MFSWQECSKKKAQYSTILLYDTLLNNTEERCLIFLLSLNFSLVLAGGWWCLKTTWQYFKYCDTGSLTHCRLCQCVSLHVREIYGFKSFQIDSWPKTKINKTTTNDDDPSSSPNHPGTFESETKHGDSFHYAIWFVVSKMRISKNKNVENIKMKQETHVYEWIAGAHFEGTHKNKSSRCPDSQLYWAALSLHSREAVGVRFEAVGLGVVERLHLLFGCPFVAGLLFPQQMSAVVEQVGGQQEARQWEDEQA